MEETTIKYVKVPTLNLVCWSHKINKLNIKLLYKVKVSNNGERTPSFRKTMDRKIPHSPRVDISKATDRTGKA